MQKTTLFLLFAIFVLILSCGVVRDHPNTVIIAITEENLEGFDSLVEWGGIGSRLFYSTLLAYDEKFAVVNDLAYQYKLSPDKLTWTVKIRTDSRFHNGKELNAKDVVYTFMTAASIENWLDLSMLEKAEAYDAATVIFTLKRPDMSFIHPLATLGIIPENSLDPEQEQIPAGSGPYKFIASNENKEIILEANQNYYGKKPEFERIVLLVTDEQQAFQYALEGKIDILPVPISKSSFLVEGTRLVSIGSVEKRAIFFPLIPKTTGIDGSIRGNDVTSDVSIRKAIDSAMNRDNIVAGILGGHGTPIYGPADGFPWDEPAGRLTWGRTRTSKNILAGAGWKDLNRDGILEKNGISAEFTLYYPQSDFIAQSMAIACANTALEIGIKIIPEGRPRDELGELMYYNPVMFSWGSHNPFEINNLFHSSNTGSENYPSYYRNTRVDTRIEGVKSSATFTAAVQQLQQVQWDGVTGVSMRGDAPIVWLANISHTYFVNNKLVVGSSRLEKRGSGWPVLESILSWSWKK
ncbi:MAG: hypothetical protein JW904_00905 [Spirochaetales bacterium]|nr:hypothetical protein [Spirochaetales bacterium]